MWLSTNIISPNSYQLDLISSYIESSLNSLQKADRNPLFICMRNSVQLCCSFTDFSPHEIACCHVFLKPVFSNKSLHQRASAFYLFMGIVDSFVQVILSKLTLTILMKQYVVAIKQELNCHLNLSHWIAASSRILVEKLTTFKTTYNH